MEEKIYLNGQDYFLDKPTNISRLINTLPLGNRAVVVEVNGEIVDKNRHDETIIKKGDRVEIISFVGGG